MKFCLIMMLFIIGLQISPGLGYWLFWFSFLMSCMFGDSK